MDPDHDRNMLLVGNNMERNIDIEEETILLAHHCTVVRVELGTHHLGLPGHIKQRLARLKLYWLLEPQLFCGGSGVPDTEQIEI